LKVEKYLARELFFTEFLGIFIHGFFEFVIAGYLNNRSFISTTYGEVVSYVFAQACFFMSLIVLPCILIYVWRHDLYLFQFGEFRQRWGVAY